MGNKEKIIQEKITQLQLVIASEKNLVEIHKKELHDLENQISKTPKSINTNAVNHYINKIEQNQNRQKNKRKGFGLL